MTEAAATDRPGAQPEEQVDPQQILRFLARRRQGRGELMAVLQDIQDHYGYLPQEALGILADATGRSLVDIYGLATFYRSFTLQPRGKHLITACLGTACHVRGAPRVVKELEHQLGVKAGETTPDRQFTLETVNCLGACALGPIVVIDGHYFSNVTSPKVKGMLQTAQAGLLQVEDSAAATW